MIKKLRSQEEIVNGWGDNTSPLLSVKCITYNHAPFIEQAITSFLEQITTFPIEIVIHDDASTDGTTEIIERYQNDYPLIIRAVIQEDNQYSQGRKPNEFVDHLLKGKYVAFCEGDDYWLDAFKLQKQVDFLEKNPKYVISGHDALVVDSKGEMISNSKITNKHKRDYSGYELSCGDAWVLTLTWVYRNVDIVVPSEKNNVLNGDNFYLSLLGSYGDFKYHNDIEPAAYRRHSGGVWSSIDRESQLEEKLNTLYWMYKYHKRVGNFEVSEQLFSKYKSKLVSRLSLLDILGFLYLKLKELLKGL